MASSNIMPVVRSIYLTVTALSTGTESSGLLGLPMAGILNQIIVRASSGGGASCDVEVRTQSGVSTAETLIYQNTGAAYTLIDSNIGAYFDTKVPSTDNDLYLYLAPATNGTLEVRLDFLIYM